MRPDERSRGGLRLHGGRSRLTRARRSRPHRRARLSRRPRNVVPRGRGSAGVPATCRHTSIVGVERAGIRQCAARCALRGRRRPDEPTPSVEPAQRDSLQRATCRHASIVGRGAGIRQSAARCALRGHCRPDDPTPSVEPAQHDSLQRATCRHASIVGGEGLESDTYRRAVCCDRATAGRRTGWLRRRPAGAPRRPDGSARWRGRRPAPRSPNRGTGRRNRSGRRDG